MNTQSNNQFNPIIAWLLNHIRACMYGFGEIVRAPLASIMTIAVIGVSMSLPSGFFLLLQNFQSISKPWDDTPSISLYLKQGISNNQIKQMLDDLKKRNDVKTVTYISPQQGLNEFKKTTEFSEFTKTLKDNPLPGVILVTPIEKEQSPTDMQNLLVDLKAIPAVDFAQLDIAWVKRLYYLITIGKRVIYTIALLFGIGVILIVGNTIRLTTQNHRQEIIILKLVGATNAFIRRPLLYRGLIYGLLGGCLAWLFVSLMLWWLSTPALRLADTYGSAFSIQGLGPITGLSILLISGTLGFLGSWLAIRRHLTAPESL